MSVANAVLRKVGHIAGYGILSWLPVEDSLARSS